MVLAAFLAGVVVVLAAAALAVLRGIGLWRQAKRTGRALSAELSTFSERSARTERLLAEAEASSRELEQALARLRASRAQLAVLVRALERASARTRWLRAFLPA
ncbi:MAG: hypothetical protein KatS3mg012_1843 [Gaiellaceae bacterium]|nr:MAG: hypothetical protein KatS3mg012_1843 [Gaiellaceae bacterium]